jgi:hypothetical protein
MSNISENLLSAGEVYFTKTGAPLPQEGYLVYCDSWDMDLFANTTAEAFIQKLIDSFEHEYFEYVVRVFFEDELICSDYYLYSETESDALEHCIENNESTYYDIANQQYLPT